MYDELFGGNKRPAGIWVLAALQKKDSFFVMYVEVMQGWKGTNPDNRQNADTFDRRLNCKSIHQMV